MVRFLTGAALIGRRDAGRYMGETPALP